MPHSRAVSRGIPPATIHASGGLQSSGPDSFHEREQLQRELLEIDRQLQQKQGFPEREGQIFAGPGNAKATNVLPFSHKLSSGKNSRASLISDQKQKMDLHEFQQQVGNIDGNRIQNFPKIKFKMVTTQQDFDRLAHEQVHQALSKNMEQSRHQNQLDPLSPQSIGPLSERYSLSQNMGRRFHAGQKGSRQDEFDRSQSFNVPPILTPRADDRAILGGTDVRSPAGMSPGEAAFRPRRGVPNTGHQQQRFKVNKNKVDYTYQPGQDDVPDDMMILSGGNKYYEKAKPLVGRFMNNLQGNIKDSKHSIDQMLNSQKKIFELMKKEKRTWMTTLKDGESKGLCRNISERSHPTRINKIRQQVQRHKIDLAERQDQAAENRRRRAAEQLEAKRKRIQDRLELMNAMTTMNPKTRAPTNPLKGALKKPGATTGSLGAETQGQPQVAFQDDVDGSVCVSQASSANATRSQKKVQIKVDEHEQYVSPSEEVELLVPGTTENQQRGLEGGQGEALQHDLSRQMTSGETNLQKGPASKDVGSSGQAARQRNASVKKPSSTARLQEKDLVKSLALGLALPVLAKDLSDELIREFHHPSDGIFVKLAKHFQTTKSKEESSKAQATGKGVQKLFSPRDLQVENVAKGPLYNDSKMRSFFRSMSTDPTSHKQLNLDINLFTKFLHDRYSKLIGDRILQFMDYTSDYPLYGIDWTDYCRMIMGFLNDGPTKNYKEMLFICLSLSNNGRICEHDVFTVLEQFKQRDSFFFYQELIDPKKEVPRDFNNQLDTSDQIFFDAFVKDVKVISQIINLRKRMMGIEDDDTTEGIERDFKALAGEGDSAVDTGTTSQEQRRKQVEELEEEIMIQIDYIMGVVAKKPGWKDQKDPSGGQTANQGESSESPKLSRLQRDVCNIVMKAKTVLDLRNQLCKFVASRGLATATLHKRQSSMSANSDREPKAQAAKRASQNSPGGGPAINYVKPPKDKDVKPCLGAGAPKKSMSEKIRQITDPEGEPVAAPNPPCIYITCDDLEKYLSYKRPAQGLNNGIIPTLAQHFLHSITDGRIDIVQFEALNGDLREAVAAEVQRKPIQENANNQRNQTNSPQNLWREGPPKKAEKAQVVFTTANEDDDFDQKHHKITHPFVIEKYYNASQELAGKKLTRKTREVVEDKSKKRKSDQDPKAASGNAQASNLEIVYAHDIQELQGYKDHFGLDNFLNIFNCFYSLSAIPEDAQNNPFALYIDITSVVRGFESTFGSSNEEMALRFFKMFIPEGGSMRQQVKIDRFYQVAKQMCDINPEQATHVKCAFKFYDYYDNGSVGSVDIVHLSAISPDEPRAGQGEHNSKRNRLEKILKKYRKTGATDKDKRKNRTIEVVSVDNNSTTLQTSSKKKMRGFNDSQQTSLNQQSSDESDYDSDKGESSSEEEEGRAESRSVGSRWGQEEMVASQAQIERAAQDYQADPPGERHCARGGGGADLGASLSSVNRQSHDPQGHTTSAEALAQKRSRALQEQTKMAKKAAKKRLSQVYIEIAELRDEFINVAVIPTQKSEFGEQSTLSLKYFEGPFLTELRNRYDIEAPAITHFFRDRFICVKSKTNKYGKALEEALQSATPGPAAAAKAQKDLKEKDASDLDFQWIRDRMNWPDASSQFLETLLSLQRLSTYPRGLHTTTGNAPQE